MPTNQYDNRNRLDPARSNKDAPPNYGRPVLPQIFTFQGLVSSIAKTYKNPDEAIKHSLDNARYMRNDCLIMECIEARQRSVALLDWHVEVDGPESPAHKALADKLTGILKNTYRFTEYRRCLLEAIWCGRHAVQHRFGWKIKSDCRELVIDHWTPINGDKLAFRYDDGSEDHQRDEVGVRVGAGFKQNDLIRGRVVVPCIDGGMAVFLAPYERNLIALHKHMIEDASFEDPLGAGSIHGIGIRSRIYWEWFQKQELLALFVEYMERSALGFEIWYYEQGNPQSLADTKTAAENRNGRKNIILVGKPMGDDNMTYGVERFEPGASGADAFQRWLDEHHGWRIKRYILGQTMTSEAGPAGLGSEGIAGLHLQTMLDIVKYDATNLEETITRETLIPLKTMNCPEAHGVDVRFVIQTQNPDVEGKLKSMQAAYEMGARIKESDVMDAIGASLAEPGEPFLQNPQGGRNDGLGEAGPGATNSTSVSMGGLEGKFKQALNVGGHGDALETVRQELGMNGNGNGHDDSADRLALALRMRRERYAFDESKVDRDDDGKFALQGGSATSKPKFKAEDSDKGSQKKIFSGMDALPGQGNLFDTDGEESPASEPKTAGQKRAKSGGEVGPNGEHYPGGAFIATTDLPKRAKDKLIKDAAGKVVVDPGEYAIPEPGQMSILDKLGGTVFNHRDGQINHQYLEYIGATEADVAMYEDLVGQYRDGKRWVDVNDYPKIATYKDAARLFAADKPVPGAILDKLPAEYRDKLSKYRRTGPVVRYRESPNTPAGMRWITLNSSPGEDGARILIDGSGNIHAGPKKLTGKNLSSLSDGKADAFDPGEWDKPRKAFKPSNRFEQLVGETAAEWNVDPHDLRETAEHIFEERRTINDEREAAKKAARQRTGLTQQDVERLQNSGFDYSSGHKAGGETGQKLRAFDAVAQELARELPELGLGDPDDPGADFAANLWDILAEGRQATLPKHHPDIIREAADLMHRGNRQVFKEAVEAVPFARRSTGVVVDRMNSQLRERFLQAVARYSGFKEHEHPRDDAGKFRPTHSMSRSEFHKQEKSKDGYEPGDTNRRWKAAMQEAIAEGKDVNPQDVSEFTDLSKQLKERPEPEPSKPEEPEAKSEAADEPEAKPEPKVAGDAGKSTQKDLFDSPGSDAPDPLDADDPRAAAEEAADAEAESSEYAFARESSVQNAGEDLLGSARHKRNAWRGLAEAEADGTAEEMVNRKTLLKAEPIDVVSKMRGANALSSLAGHLAMQKFPSEVEYGREKDPDKRAAMRSDYVTAYSNIKEAAEAAAAEELDPRLATKKINDSVVAEIERIRGGKNLTVENKDRYYSPIANSLVGMYKATKVGGWGGPTPTSVLGRLGDFASRAKGAYGTDLSAEYLDKVRGHALDVIEGDSFNKSFGTVEGGKGKTFSSADMYVKHAERKGGRVVDAKTVASGTSFMLKNLSMRGVQYGNSVTDDERQHHLTKASEAFADLADITGLPDEMMSFGGKLGLAIGARGHGNASAHYEPTTKVINLTRKSGVGSLAHEWGHFFDHMISNRTTEGGGWISSRGDTGGNYASEQFGGVTSSRQPDGTWKKTKDEGPVLDAYNEYREALNKSGFPKRLQENARAMVKARQMSEKKSRDYWQSGREVFARNFERYVQHKLKAGGRENTYLAGLMESGQDSLWATDAEIEHMAPAFEKILKVAKEQSAKVDRMRRYRPNWSYA